MASETQLSSDTLQYLTGALTGEARELFETRLLVDQDFSDAVAVCIQELIDSFALGQMDPGEARSFASWIAAAPARSERVRMARVLLQEKPPASSRPKRRFALILAAAACALAATAITLHLARTSGSQAQLPATAKVASTVSSPAGGTPAGGSTKPAVILLVAERLRGEAPITKYQIHPGTPVELQVLLTSKTPGTLYKLQIFSDDRKPRLHVERDGLKVQNKGGQAYIEVMLPAGSLPPATYDVLVSAGEDRLSSRFAIR